MRKTKLRLVKNPVMVNGKPFYLVRFPKPDGGGGRRHFKSKVDAQGFLQLKSVEIENFGASAAALTERDRAEYLDCVELLEPYGISLRDAVKKIIPELKSKSQSVALTDGVAEFLKAKEKDGASKRYLKDLKNRLNIFCRAFPDEVVASFSTSKIDDWLRDLPHEAVTRNNYRRLLGVYFNHAVKRGHILSNPITDSTRAKEISGKVGILTPAEAQALLENADEVILPAIALGLFAGLRPESEVWHLDWSHIDFESGLISIDSDKTKTGEGRFVKMENNLVAWLNPIKKVKGSVSPKGDKYFDHLKKARDAAKIKNWEPDCLRHSFGSYHYAHFKNIGTVMYEMGHTNPKTFTKHYRARVKPDPAAKYWEIVPPEKA